MSCSKKYCNYELWKTKKRSQTLKYPKVEGHSTVCFGAPKFGRYATIIFTHLLCIIQDPSNDNLWYMKKRNKKYGRSKGF